MSTLMHPSTHSFNMAEDDMEITSEHGHMEGDEDIDIDFDFTAGLQDGDHILEDLTTDDSGNMQLSPTMANDELMIDEDDQSYQMDDTDILLEEVTENIETGSTSLETAALRIFDEQPNIQLSGIEGLEEPSNVEQLEDAQEDTSPVHPGIAFNDVPVEQITHIHGAQEDVPTEISADVPLDRAEHEYQDSPKISDTKDIQDLSPFSTRDGDDKLESGIETSNLSESNASAYKDLHGEVHARDIDDFGVSSALSNLLVHWDGKEYPLFSTSELDDPDTYFLSDVTILYQPLLKFLGTIREVVQADMGEEDEIVLCIDDLGLEISEGSCKELERKESGTTIPADDTSAGSVSLSHIIALWEQLLQNEAADSSQNLHDNLILSFTVKKNCWKRLVNLQNGASEGKPLSDFWDHHSTGTVEVDAENRALHDPDSRSESPLANETDFDNAEIENDEHCAAPADEVQSLEVTDGHGVEIKSTTPAVQNNESKVIMNCEPTTAHLEQAIGISKVLGVDEPNAEKNLDGDIDEDGDFIDYDDDELVHGEDNQVESPTQKADIGQENVERVHDDQSPPRGSFSPQNEETEELRSESHILGADGVIENDQTLFENGLDDADYTAATLADDIVVKGHGEVEKREDIDEKDNPLNNNDDNNGMYENDDNDEGTFIEDYGQHKKTDEHTEYMDSFNRGEDLLENEHISEVSQLTHDQNSPENTGDYPLESKPNGATEHNSTSATDNIAFPDTADSSVTLGADEIQYEELQESGEPYSLDQYDTTLKTANDEVDELHQDEIDYEDDEEENGIELISTGQSQSQAGEVFNGKRSIAEVDADDTLDARGNGIKRTRS